MANFCSGVQFCKASEMEGIPSISALGFTSDYLSKQMFSFYYLVSTFKLSHMHLDGELTRSNAAGFLGCPGLWRVVERSGCILSRCRRVDTPQLLYPLTCCISFHHNLLSTAWQLKKMAMNMFSLQHQKVYDFDISCRPPACGPRTSLSIFCQHTARIHS